MKYCQNCILPDTKPGVYLDDKGFCNACRNNLIKKKINWKERFVQLKKIAKELKKKNKDGHYDCIVPISSGGKDSWFQAYVMSKVLGCKVLCVNLVAHIPTTEGIHNINAMIKDLNVDILKITLKPSVHSYLRKKSFIKLGEPNWAEHCMVFAGVFNAAKIYNIPLIVWGEDVSFEFGGLSKKQTPDASNLLYNNDLIKDKNVFDLLDKNISKKDLLFYEFPSKKEIIKSKIKSIYLGYFVNWDGGQNYQFVKKRGFKSEKIKRNGHYVDYDNIDEKLCDVNGWMKYLKMGFWYPTDELCYEIYNKRLTRKEAARIVKNLTEEFPSYIDDFLRFHKMSKEEFYEVANKFVNKKIFRKHNNWWRLKKFP